MDSRPTRAHIAATFALALYMAGVPIASVLLWSWTPIVLGTGVFFGVLIGGVGVAMIKDRRRPEGLEADSPVGDLPRPQCAGHDD